MDGIIDAIEEINKNYNYEEISICVGKENKSIFEKIDFSKYKNVEINFVSSKEFVELFLKD